MTIREYLQSKLSAFGSLTEADFAGVNLPLDDDYSDKYEESVGKALCGMIEERILAPHVSNVSESGFSVSWDYANLAKYYLWLCRKYGITPNEDVVASSGLNVIKDISNIW